MWYLSSTICNFNRRLQYVLNWLRLVLHDILLNDFRIACYLFVVLRSTTLLHVRYFTKGMNFFFQEVKTSAAVTSVEIKELDSLEPSTSSTSSISSVEYYPKSRCYWNDCTECFVSDNDLYDHVIKVINICNCIQMRFYRCKMQTVS